MRARRSVAPASVCGIGGISFAVEFFPFAILLSCFGAFGGARVSACAERGTKMTTDRRKQFTARPNCSGKMFGAVATPAIISHNRRLNHADTYSARCAATAVAGTGAAVNPDAVVRSLGR